MEVSGRCVGVTSRRREGRREQGEVTGRHDGKEEQASGREEGEVDKDKQKEVCRMDKGLRIKQEVMTVIIYSRLSLNHVVGISEGQVSRVQTGVVISRYCT